jgi:hypothetical protein
VFKYVIDGYLILKIKSDFNLNLLFLIIL